MTCFLVAVRLPFLQLGCRSVAVSGWQSLYFLGGLWTLNKRKLLIFNKKINKLNVVESFGTNFVLATNQGVVGSIPASRTKNESLQRKLQAFSFCRD